jgi:hypothetical protein
MENTFIDDLAAVARIDSVPAILEVVCRTTGMGFLGSRPAQPASGDRRRLDGVGQDGDR